MYRDNSGKVQIKFATMRLGTILMMFNENNFIL